MLHGRRVTDTGRKGREVRQEPLAGDEVGPGRPNSGERSDVGAQPGGSGTSGRHRPRTAGKERGRPRGKGTGSRYRGFGGEEERVLVDAGNLRRALHDHADTRQGQRHQPVLAAAQPRRHLSPPTGCRPFTPSPARNGRPPRHGPLGAVVSGRRGGPRAPAAARAGGTTTPMKPRAPRPVAERRGDYKSQGAPRTHPRLLPRSLRGGDTAVPRVHPGALRGRAGLAVASLGVSPPAPRVGALGGFPQASAGPSTAGGASGLPSLSPPRRALAPG